jgi:hypothetical protein
MPINNKKLGPSIQRSRYFNFKTRKVEESISVPSIKGTNAPLPRLKRAHYQTTLGVVVVDDGFVYLFILKKELRSIANTCFDIKNI